MSAPEHPGRPVPAASKGPAPWPDEPSPRAGAPVPAPAGPPPAHPAAPAPEGAAKHPYARPSEEAPGGLKGGVRDGVHGDPYSHAPGGYGEVPSGNAGGPSLAPQEGDGRPPALSGPDGALLDAVIGALRTCYDPEIPLNIYDLSLIYSIDVDAAGHVAVRMTLTSPTCPVAGTLPGEVQQKVGCVPGVTSAQVELVWDPPWDLSRLSEAARLTLGIG